MEGGGSTQASITGQNASSRAEPLYSNLRGKTRHVDGLMPYAFEQEARSQRLPSSTKSACAPYAKITEPKCHLSTAAHSHGLPSDTEGGRESGRGSFEKISCMYGSVVTGELELVFPLILLLLGLVC